MRDAGGWGVFSTCPAEIWHRSSPEQQAGRLLPAHASAPSHKQEMGCRAPKQDPGCWSLWSPPSPSQVQDAAAACTQGSMIPVQHPAPAQPQCQKEMCGTCPQPGCAPDTHHSHVPLETAQPAAPLLLLGAAPATWCLSNGNVHQWCGWLWPCCACDVCHGKGMGKCPHQCLK